MKKIIDRKRIDKFWKDRTAIKNPRVATHFKEDDTHVYDLALINKYVKPDSKVLDLACGTCYISNELVGKVSYIKGVDKFGEYLKHCKVSKNFEVEKKDLLKFTDAKKYDLIILIGIMLFFDDKDTGAIYKKCLKLLNDGGVVIIRQQYGVGRDVVVDKYSETVGSNYFAYYRSLKKEITILSKFFQVKTVDIMPKRLNPWPETHHYALICRKK